MTKIVLIASTILAATSVSAFAYTPSHNDIHAREQAQLNAIEQGRENGSITWREGLRLRAEQQRIKQLEESYEADGRLSRQERANLNALQNQASQDIRHDQNNGWFRAWWLPRFGR